MNRSRWKRLLLAAGLLRSGQTQKGDMTDADSSRVMIVGLGNPGREYRHNRHNVGFMAVDRLAATHGLDLGRVQQKAVVGRGRIDGRSVILAKPQTFMNRSGDAVGPLAKFYKLPTQQIVVIYDDIDLPLGILRLRPHGGSGGHNGMKSIIQHLGTGFPRVRLGIGRPPGRMSPAAYVLQDFATEEQEEVNALLDQTVAAVEAILSEGIEIAMNRHNGTATEES